MGIKIINFIINHNLIYGFQEKTGKRCVFNDAGCWILDARSWMLDTGCRILDAWISREWTVDSRGSGGLRTFICNNNVNSDELISLWMIMI